MKLTKPKTVANLYSRAIISLCLVASSLLLKAQDTGVSINTTGNPPDPSAILDVTSDGKGILIPRISMLSLPMNPAPGLLLYIYDIDPGFWYFDGMGWYRLMRTVDQKWYGGSDIYYLGGRVGIGTALPSSLLDLEFSGSAADGLEINSTGTGNSQISFRSAGESKAAIGVDNLDQNKFKFGGTTLSPNARMTITEGGNIGIGTESPSSRLDLESSNASETSLDINNTTTTGDPQVRFQVSGDSKFTLGVDNSDADKFKLGGSVLSPSAKMTITAGGDMGIGTEAPSSRLDIESADNTATGVEINNTTVNGDPQLQFQVSGAAKFTMGVDNSDADKLKIGTTAVSTSTRMTVTSTGEVGIGTEAPTATLQLNGTAKMLGPWETKYEGIDYLAPTDGFVVAGMVISPGSGNTNASMNGYTDNNTHPATLRGVVCVRKIGTGTTNGQDSFTMPVRKGNYWRVDTVWIEGSVVYSIEFIPLGGSNP